MFCKQCGNKIEDTSLTKCPKCNTGIGKGGRFCENCGSKLVKGTLCSCVVKKEEPKVEVNSVAKKENKEEKEPEILKNERVRNNPLFARIAAQEENTDVDEVLYNEAYKIAKKENLISDINLVEKSEDKSEEVPKLSEEIPVLEKTEINKADNQETNDIASIPQINKTESVKNVKPIENEKPVLPKLTPEEINPLPVSSAVAVPLIKEEKDTKVNNLFPDTFNSKPPMVQPIPAPVVKAPKSKKSFDFCSCAANLILIFAFFVKNSSVLAFCLLSIVSLILGIIDTAVNEKKTGVGAIIASVFTMIYVLIQNFLF